jgi:hypothetical protein
MPLLEQIVAISTTGARAVETFEIDGVRYLAIPQLAADVPGTLAELPPPVTPVLGQADPADHVIRPAGVVADLGRAGTAAEQPQREHSGHDHAACAANHRASRGPQVGPGHQHRAAAR